jgi:spore maturation protein A
MSYIWSFIIIISIVFSIFTGRIVEINNVILTTAFEALKTYGMVASNIILWSGILEVCISSGVMKYLTFFVKPFIRKLFKTKDELTLDCISANIACNIFALGSASTPFAIKAMTRLQEENPDKSKESKDMATLIIINVCGFTIIPTSLISLRANYNSNENGLVLFYVLLFSFVTTVIMLIINKVVK